MNDKTCLQLAAMVSVKEKLRVIFLIAGAASAEANCEHLVCDRVMPRQPYSDMIAEALRPFSRLFDKLKSQMHDTVDAQEEEEEEGIDMILFPGPKTRPS